MRYQSESDQNDLDKNRAIVTLFRLCQSSDLAGNDRDADQGYLDRTNRNWPNSDLNHRDDDHDQDRTGQ